VCGGSVQCARGQGGAGVGKSAPGVWRGKKGNSCWLPFFYAGSNMNPQAQGHRTTRWYGDEPGRGELAKVGNFQPGGKGRIAG